MRFMHIKVDAMLFKINPITYNTLRCVRYLEKLKKNDLKLQCYNINWHVACKYV